MWNSVRDLFSQASKSCSNIRMANEPFLLVLKYTTTHVSFCVSVGCTDTICWISIGTVDSLSIMIWPFHTEYSFFVNVIRKRNVSVVHSFRHCGQQTQTAVPDIMLLWGIRVAIKRRKSSISAFLLVCSTALSFYLVWCLKQHCAARRLHHHGRRNTQRTCLLMVTPLVNQPLCKSCCS